MAEMINMDEYRNTRPKRQRRLDPFFKIPSKFTRDWVFSWKIRNKIYKYMGIKMPENSPGIYVGRETWLDDKFPELITLEEGEKELFLDGDAIFLFIMRKLNRK